MFFIAPLAACCLVLSGDAPVGETPQPPTTQNQAAADAIGVATMLPNRTILVGIRAPGSAADSALAAVLMVEPGDTQYDVLIAHLGGLNPGETKPIPPWPDQRPPPKADAPRPGEN